MIHQKILRMFLAIAMFAPSYSMANEQGMQKGSSDSWEQHLGEKKQRANDDLQKRIDQIEREFAGKSGTSPDMAKIKDEKIAFERQKTADYLSFLDVLAKTPEPQRQAAWDNFNMQQKTKQQEFDSHMRAYWSGASSHK